MSHCYNAYFLRMVQREKSYAEEIKLLDEIHLHGVSGLLACTGYSNPGVDTDQISRSVMERLAVIQSRPRSDLIRLSKSIQVFDLITLPEVIPTNLLDFEELAKSSGKANLDYWSIQRVRELFGSYSTIAQLIKTIFIEGDKHLDELRIMQSELDGTNNQLRNAHALIKRNKLKQDVSFSEEELKALIDRHRFPTSDKVNLTKLGKELGCYRDTAKRILFNHNLGRYANIN